MDAFLEVHANGVEMAVEGLEELAVVEPVLKHDNVTPTCRGWAGEHHEAVTHGVYRIAQVRIFPADSVQVIPEVIDFTELPGIVGEGALFTAEGTREACRPRRLGQLDRRGQRETGGEQRLGVLRASGEDQSEARRALSRREGAGRLMEQPDKAGSRQAEEDQLRRKTRLAGASRCKVWLGRRHGRNNTEVGTRQDGTRRAPVQLTPGGNRVEWRSGVR